MVPIKKTFLHFFDIHYLEEKGISSLQKQIFKEANFATRFSLLSSDTTIIPAAVYIESNICHKILSNLKELIPYGIIQLIGNARSFREFCEKKIIQYANRPEHQKLYIQALNDGVEFPFRKRERSSTKDISNSWISLLNEEDVGLYFSRYDGIIIGKKFEDRWDNIPCNLGRNAFIVPNVSSLLFPNQIENISVTNELHSIINPAYFSSYVNELEASIVTHLNILEPNYTISNNEINVPYKYILQELYKRKLVENIANQHPNDLMILRENEQWLNIFHSACECALRVTSDAELFYKRKEIISNGTIIHSKNTFLNQGVMNMGDQYNAKQVGAQGPNAHAHDMTFNQLWQNNDKIDLISLSKELQQLRINLGQTAETAEQHKETGIIAEAEIEANNDNGPKVLELLAKTGTWTLKVAEKIGVGLVISTLKNILANS